MAKNERRTEVYSVFITEKMTGKDYTGSAKLKDIILLFLNANKNEGKNVSKFEIKGTNDLVPFPH